MPDELKQNSINDKSSVEQDSSDTEKKGVRLLLDQALQSYIRLPMLEIIYDRFIRLNSSSLRNYTSDTVDIKIREMSTKRFGDYIESLETQCMLSVFKALELNNYGLMVIDSQLIYSFVEILFGGRKVSSSLRVEGRPFTSIETNIVKSITEIILNDLSASFDQLTSVTFELDRVETNPKFAMIVRPDDAAVIVELDIILEERSGSIAIILPYNTIDPIKKLLSKLYIGEKGSKDPTWTRHFEHEIYQTNINVEVTLSGTVSKIQDLANLAIGKTLVLDKLANEDWDIRINNIKVGTAKPGKIRDRIAAKLTSDSINTVKYNQ